MTADVIIYGGTLVPVGEDQTPHIRLMQRTAERFNRTFNREVFRVPKILLTPEARVPGVDWRKMSKSYGNAIDIADTEDDTVKKVRTMFTDPTKIRRGDPGHPVRLLGPRRSEDERIAEMDLRTQTELVEYNPGCVAYYMHRIFSPDYAAEVRATCEDGSRLCSDCKVELADVINDYLRPIRQRRKELEQQPEYIDRVLTEGAEKARELAQRTMSEARKAMGLHYRSA